MIPDYKYPRQNGPTLSLETLFSSPLLSSPKSCPHCVCIFLWGEGASDMVKEKWGDLWEVGEGVSGTRTVWGGTRRGWAKIDKKGKGTGRGREG